MKVDARVTQAAAAAAAGWWWPPYITYHPRSDRNALRKTRRLA